VDDVAVPAPAITGMSDQEIEVRGSRGASDRGDSSELPARAVPAGGADGGGERARAEG
jgi:hypothetical protein